MLRYQHTERIWSKGVSFKFHFGPGPAYMINADCKHMEGGWEMISFAATWRVGPKSSILEPTLVWGKRMDLFSLRVKAPYPLNGAVLVTKQDLSSRTWGEEP